MKYKKIYLITLREILEWVLNFRPDEDPIEYLRLSGSKISYTMAGIKITIPKAKLGVKVIEMYKRKGISGQQLLDIIDKKLEEGYNMAIVTDNSIAITKKYYTYSPYIY